jgi:hypothetical protein
VLAGVPRLGGGGTTGVMGRLARESKGGRGDRGRSPSMGVGGRAMGVYGGGCVGGGGCEGRMLIGSPGLDRRERLYSRQHCGQRHSTTREPSPLLKRVRRQPNCALMSV